MPTSFEDTEEAVLYSAKSIITPSGTVDTITVMTWNIRFGAGRGAWFGDSCGDRVILPESEVRANLNLLKIKLESVQPDILLLQEVDVQSKRSAYIDQVQWLLDNTYFNYGAYASMWQAEVVPSDGLGRVDAGNAILSRWEVTEAERIKLPPRGDQDALTKLFYLRRNILRTRIALPGVTKFYAVDVHATAFATDDTKKKHLGMFKEELDAIVSEGGIFVAGGDLNEIPPGAVITDYCLEDMCRGESFHQPGDDPQHKEGSFFTPETTWLNDLYATYSPGVPLADYLATESLYFTHTTQYNNPSGWDRKLDYLWTMTSNPWIAGSDSTHQDATEHSDHIPVSARWAVP